MLRGSLAIENPFAHTDSPPCGQSILVSFRFPHLPGNSKPIAPPFQNGFLQVAVSKTLRHPAFRAPESFICRSASDTALGLPGPNPANFLERRLWTVCLIPSEMGPALVRVADQNEAAGAADASRG
jgi:hypothetical protein